MNSTRARAAKRTRISGSSAAHPRWPAWASHAVPTPPPPSNRPRGRWKPSATFLRSECGVPAGRHDDIGDRARSRGKPFGEKLVERRRRPRLGDEVDYGHADGEEQRNQDYDGTVGHRLPPEAFSDCLLEVFPVYLMDSCAY